MRKSAFAFLVVLVLFSPGLCAFQGESKNEALRQEEIEDYYEKWLREDVVFIITDEEKGVFRELSTPEEKEQFIEQFWFRRDPDPRSSFNEFKEEHYRRIAYANEHFTSGDPGWMTDRGRIYIIHGPPDNLESRPMGGTYVRRPEEGGSVGAVFPFERWTYRYIEGLGENVELEFVDTTESGKYELAVNKWDKEGVLQMSPSSGANYFEEIGMSTRASRPALMPAAGGAGYGVQSQYTRLTDTPFKRYETVAKIGAAPITKYQDLKQLVEVNIQYSNLPFRIKEDYFKLNEAQVLVPITVELSNKDLSFELENDKQVARVAVYGIVTSLTNRIVTEFEDDFVLRYPVEGLQNGLLKSSVYQKIIPVERKGRYKLDLILKDLNSLQTGVIRKALVPPAFQETRLEGSSLILSDQIKTLNDVPEDNDMFVIGDVRVLPRMDQTFTTDMPLGVYYQIYNAALDQSTLKPALRVTFSLLKDGALLAQAADEDGESIQFFSSRRVVLVKSLSLAGLEPGKHQIEIKVEDLLTKQEISQAGTFTVTGTKG